MKKFLIIMSGNPRGGEITWKSMYKHLLYPTDSDLAICTGSKWLNQQSFLKEAKYKWIIDEPDDWFDYYKNNFVGNWKQYFELGKDTGLYNSGSIHFALKDIVRKNHIDVLNNYENIIYTRFDQFYIDKQTFFDDESILIPTGEDYFGVCDRHALVPTKYIDKYLDICKYINTPASLENVPKHLNCEVAYLKYLKYSNLFNFVKRYERSQFTTAIKNDPTNWRVAKYKIYFYGGLKIKYPDEFINSVKNYKRSRGNLKSIKDLKILFLNYIYLQIRRNLGMLFN